MLLLLGVPALELSAEALGALIPLLFCTVDAQPAGTVGRAAGRRRKTTDTGRRRIRIPLAARPKPVLGSSPADVAQPDGFFQM